MAKYSFNKLLINDVILIVPEIINDIRGFFSVSYNKFEFQKNGIEAEFVQDNYVKSNKNVLRGLHYQIKPKVQAKLVQCIEGCIFDVAVDIRRNSKTFGKWVGEILSEDNNCLLYIPEGFAHGYVTLSDTAKVLYKVAGDYSPECERGILWNDPDIAIDWNIDFIPVLNEKDKKQPFLKDIKELL